MDHSQSTLSWEPALLFFDVQRTGFFFFLSSSLCSGHWFRNRAFSLKIRSVQQYPGSLSNFKVLHQTRTSQCVIGIHHMICSLWHVNRTFDIHLESLWKWKGTKWRSHIHSKCIYTAVQRSDDCQKQRLLPLSLSAVNFFKTICRQCAALFLLVSVKTIV